MRSRIAVALALVALAGCRVEGGRTNRAPGQPAALDTSAEAARALAPGLAHTVFARKREVVAPGLVRVTVSAIVRFDAGADSAKKVLEALLASERSADTGAAAIRVLGFLPPPAGHGAGAQGQMVLIPLAFTDWAPEPGWDSLSAATRHRPYSTTTRFVHDAAALRGMGFGAVPGGALPPGHPSPRRP
ncbi:MAG: hypothetical protein ABSB58_01250 [Gemmatimonadales bacterium]|jgi:hypothetical protein